MRKKYVQFTISFLLIWLASQSASATARAFDHPLPAKVKVASITKVSKYKAYSPFGHHDFEMAYLSIGQQYLHGCMCKRAGENTISFLPTTPQRPENEPFITQCASLHLMFRSGMIFPVHFFW
ncbi:hypothetical protein LX64_03293 [Chitinophaga skermanii]|uniref:Uncharacterized protein n=1 Tax=Chitinophaga skermanii TaxID=331697 RepID=A0A327QET0_9BACT|nr:hypothetical protein [Chitinophaga skermanii]RAJ02284.1 hypothetical protein LX64_03293 [Chitinophaga skermanii]